METLLLERRACWPVGWRLAKSPSEQGNRELEQSAKTSWREEP